MIGFAVNLALALAFAVGIGELSMPALVAGFVLGYYLLGLVHYAMGRRLGYGTRGWRLLRFAYFITILMRANLQVLWEVLTPGYQMQPRIIRYNIEGLNDVQVTALANAITLTPGTLAMDVSDDRRFMYVHCMYARDRESAERELDDLRRRVTREVFE